MRLARLAIDNDEAWGFVEGEDVWTAPNDGPDLLSALAAGPSGLSAVRDRCLQALPLSSVTLLPPIHRPSKVVCVGLNYGDHARESGMKVPDQPLVFLKFPSSITGPYDVIELPTVAKQVDWEAELAVVVGRRATQVSPEDALDSVAGYMVANDVSARDIQAADGQWVRAKSFASFCPIGPWVTTKDEVGDGSGLAVQLSVNGVLKQDGNTSDLVSDVRRLVSFVSHVAPLEVGDIILTGTPAGTGVGMSPQEFLAVGDEVVTTISGLGSLINHVVEGTR